MDLVEEVSFVSDRPLSPGEILVEEIALEGLEGITLEALWVRLELNKYWSLKPVDEDVRKFIWDVIKVLEDIEWYKIKSSRPLPFIRPPYDDLKIFVDEGYEVISNKTIYPLSIIHDGHIRGSCAEYSTRLNISEEIRNMTPKDIQQKYGSTIVAVASQEQRNAVLFNASLNPNIDISDATYCVLEYIGRGRCTGELSVVVNYVLQKCNMAGYVWKRLLALRLITMQGCSININNRSAQAKVLHLVKFYQKIPDKLDISMQNVVNYLKSINQTKIPFAEAKDKFKLPYLNKLRKKKSFHKYFKIKVFPYRVYHPEATPEEYLTANKGERRLRSLVLKDDNIETTGELNEEVSGVDQDEEEEEEEETYADCILKGTRYFDRTLSYQCYHYVRESGTRGVTMKELAKQFGLRRRKVRAVMKLLETDGLVKRYSFEHSRQHIMKFFVTKYANMKKREIENEKKRMQQMMLETDKIPKKKFKKDTSAESRKDDDAQASDMDVSSQPEFVESASVEEETMGPPEQSGNLCVGGTDLSYTSRSDVPEKGDELSESKQIEKDQLEAEKGEEKIIEQDMESFDEAKSCEEQKVENEQEEEEEEEEEEDELEMLIAAEQEQNNSDDNSDRGDDESGDSEDEKSKEPLAEETDIGTLTLVRRAKRSCQILMKINKEKVIQGYHMLFKEIRMMEANEGVSEVPCRKTVRRIVSDLEAEGKVNIVRRTVESTITGREKDCVFICASDIREDNSLVQAAIQQEEVNLSVALKQDKSQPKIDIDLHIADFLSAFPLSETSSLILDKRAGRRYGHAPKFIRMRMLHEIMFYVVYGYEGHNEKLDQSSCVDHIKSLYEENSFTNFDFPRIYKNEISWKMFIPPLRKYYYYGRGWISPFDLILSLPLCKYLCLIKVSHVVLGLEEYLDHPVKRYMLVHQLPPYIRNSLIADKKFMSSIYAIVKNLCMIGLVRFHQKDGIDFASTFIYLNRKTKLKDTRMSPPGYIKIDSSFEYPEQSYEFKTQDDVTRYWDDSLVICLNTKLGTKRCGTDDHEAIVQSLLNSAVYMKKVTKSYSVEKVEAMDTGKVPGDGLGAAGYDSSMFAGSVKNWAYKGLSKPENSALSKMIKPALKIQWKSNKTIVKKVLKRPSDSCRILPDDGKLGTDMETKENVLRTEDAFPLFRKSWVKRELYDDIDRKAIKMLRTVRSVWSTEEDEVLVMCNIAVQFATCIVPVYYSSRILIREILHKELPKSRNKTSFAASRRVKMLLRNPRIFHTVSATLKSLQEDKGIQQQFNERLEQVKSFWTNKNEREIYKCLDSIALDIFNILKTRGVKTGITDTPSAFVMPNSIQEFRAMYTCGSLVERNYSNEEVTKFFTITDEVSVRRSVAAAVVYTTLLTQKELKRNEPCDILALDQVFNQFSEADLNASFMALKKTRVIARGRFFDKFNPATFFYVGTGTFHLSQLFYTQIRPYFGTSVYQNIYSIYKGMLDGKESEPYRIESFDISVQIAFTSFLFNKQLKSRFQIDFSKPPVVTQEICDELEYKDDDEASADSSSDLSDEDSEQQEVDSDSCLDNETEDAEYYDEQNYLEGDTEELLDLYNDRVLKLYPILCFLTDNGERKQFLNENEKNEIMEKIRRSSVFVPKVCIDRDIVYRKQNSFTSQEKTRIHRMLEFLKSKAHVGASTAELREAFSDDVKFLQQATEYLMKHSAILKAGFIDTRFVHHNYALCWLIRSPDVNQPKPLQKDSGNTTRILPKPWVRITGEIGFGVFCSYLTRIMSAIYQRDGIMMKQLQTDFIPTLLPHYTQQLVEVLVELKAVHLVHVRKPKKVECFSSQEMNCILEDATGFEDEEYISCQCEHNGIIRLGEFISSLNIDDVLAYRVSKNIPTTSTVDYDSKIEAMDSETV